MTLASDVSVDEGPSYCRWVDLVGRHRTQIQRVQTRLDLPPQLVFLSLTDYLHPAVIRVQPAWFVVTYFTSPSERHVFTRHPVFLWLAEYAIVTISPWARRRSVLEATRGVNTTRDDLVCHILEAAVASHGDVGQQLNDAFFRRDGAQTPSEWHRKEGRVACFVQLLERQLQLLQAVGMENQDIRRLHEQLSGLQALFRYAEGKLRESGYCRICRRDEVLGARRGH